MFTQLQLCFWQLSELLYQGKVALLILERLIHHRNGKKDDNKVKKEEPGDMQSSHTPPGCNLRGEVREKYSYPEEYKLEFFKIWLRGTWIVQCLTS